MIRFELLFMQIRDRKYAQSNEDEFPPSRVWKNYLFDYDEIIKKKLNICCFELMYFFIINIIAPKLYNLLVVYAINIYFMF